MSAQTDCEMLSIEVMEAYAGKYNLSGNKVVELFQKNQVFEKMLIQHEYLHQVSFEEVMEFVENAIADDSRELVVYHGTCSEFEKINLNKSHNRRDFGKGFYTTILQSQSKEWAYRLSLREKRNDYYVYEFSKENGQDIVKKLDSNSKWSKNRLDNSILDDFEYNREVLEIKNGYYHYELVCRTSDENKKHNFTKEEATGWEIGVYDADKNILYYYWQSR